MDLVVHGHKLNVGRQFCGKWFAARLTWRFRCRSNRKNIEFERPLLPNCQERVYEHLRIGGCAFKVI